MNDHPTSASTYRFERRGERVFLYDSSFQPRNSADVFLWEISPLRIRFFKKSNCSDHTQTVPEFDTAPVINAYETWRSSEGARYREEHENLLTRVEEAEIASREELARRREWTVTGAVKAHAFRLRKFADYGGVDLPSQTPGRYRTSVCWSCRSDLSSTLNPTCRRCGWMVCVCGACECSMSD